MAPNYKSTIIRKYATFERGGRRIKLAPKRLARKDIHEDLVSVLKRIYDILR